MTVFNQTNQKVGIQVNKFTSEHNNVENLCLWFDYYSTKFIFFEILPSVPIEMSSNMGVVFQFQPAFWLKDDLDKMIEEIKKVKNIYLTTTNFNPRNPSTNKCFLQFHIERVTRVNEIFDMHGDPYGFELKCYCTIKHF